MVRLAICAIIVPPRSARLFAIAGPHGPHPTGTSSRLIFLNSCGVLAMPRGRGKYAERAQDLLTYQLQEAYEIANGAASEFDGVRGCSSEDDTRAWNKIVNQWS